MTNLYFNSLIKVDVHKTKVFMSVHFISNLSKYSLSNFEGEFWWLL